MKNALFIHLLTKPILFQSQPQYLDNGVAIFTDSSDFQNGNLANEFVEHRILTVIATNTVHEIYQNDALKIIHMLNLSESHISELPSRLLQNSNVIETVLLPTSLTTIHESAFFNSTISEINLLNVKIIEKQAFSKCVFLETIDLSNVNNIGMAAFSYTNLKQINLQNAQNIQDYAFYMCSELQSIENLPNECQYGKFCFGYTKISKIPFAKSVFFNNKVFYNCTIKEVNIKEQMDIEITTPFPKLEKIAIETQVYQIVIKNQPDLKEIILPENFYGEIYFSSNSKLERVHNTKYIASIPVAAFKDCISLIEIDVESVTSIGMYAFENCRNLKNLINFGISNDFVSVESFSFAGCDSLRNIDYYHIRDTPRYYLPSTSGFCYSGIETVVLNPDAIDYADTKFIGCKRLKTANLSALSIIWEYMFCDCISLTEVILPNNPLIFCEFCFANTNISSIEIPSGSIIQKYAFMHCKNLKEITWNNNINVSFTSISGDYYYQPSDLIYLNDYNYAKEPSTLAIDDFPEAHFSRIVTSFYGCTNIKKIKLADDVKDFNLGCFPNSSISEFDVSEPFKFSNDALISSNGFILYAYVGNAETYTVSENILEIKSFAFSAAKSLKSVTVNANVRVFDGAFAHCHTLESVTINSKPTYIGYQTFSHCYNLKNVRFADESKITTIQKYAFACCYKLVSLDFTGLQFISEGCFMGCISLSELDLSNIAEIPERCFWLCSNVKLSDFKINSNLKLIGNCSFADSLIESFACPENLELIESGAFENCVKLSSFNFNTRIQAIKSYTFYNCSCLESVTITNSIVHIMQNAFTFCFKLRINFEGGSHPIFDIENNCLILKESRTLVLVLGDYSGTFRVPDSITLVPSDSLDDLGIRQNKHYTKHGLVKLIIPEHSIFIHYGEYTYSRGDYENRFLNQYELDYPFPRNLQSICYEGIKFEDPDLSNSLLFFTVESAVELGGRCDTSVSEMVSATKYSAVPSAFDDIYKVDESIYNDTYYLFSKDPIFLTDTSIYVRQIFGLPYFILNNEFIVTISLVVVVSVLFVIMAILCFIVMNRNYK